MNRIRQLRRDQSLSQQALVDRINEVLAANPDLRKGTKKNPLGLVDQQTLQRLETGGILLNDRWLAVFRIIFSISSSDILGETSEEEFKLLQAYRRAGVRKRQAFLGMLDE